jgi:hypothetical protein
MSWKHTLGKPGKTYIISKSWVKKNISKSKRLPKNITKTICSDYIYNIGKHYVPNEPSKPVELWVCMKSGVLFKKDDIISFLKIFRSNEQEK